MYTNRTTGHKLSVGAGQIPFATLRMLISTDFKRARRSS